MHECLTAYMSLYHTHVCVPVCSQRTEGSVGLPENCSYRRLQAVFWVLEIRPRASGLLTTALSGYSQSWITQPTVVFLGAVSAGVWALPLWETHFFPLNVSSIFTSRNPPVLSEMLHSLHCGNIRSKPVELTLQGDFNFSGNALKMLCLSSKFSSYCSVDIIERQSESKFSRTQYLLIIKISFCSFVFCL